MNRIKHSRNIVIDNWEYIYVIAKFFEIAALALVAGYLITHW